MAIDPAGADLKRLLDEDPGGPVVMLNLVRFNGEEGQASYRKYTELAAPFVAKYGAELLYMGAGSTPLVADEGQAWDAVLVVRYPSREVFLQMVSDPGYQEVAKYRTEGLTEAVLQATIPLWPAAAREA